MKKIYLVFALALIVAPANAQNFTYDPGQSVDTQLSTNSYSDANIEITTPTVQAIQYKWQLISNDIPIGWTYSLCDYTNCYPGIPHDGTMTEITATEAANGTNGFFKITINPNDIEASATAKIYVYDSQDITMGDTIEFNFTHVIPLSVETETTQAISIYPNPANAQLNIQNTSKNSITNLSIYNVAGKIMYDSKLLGNSTESIDISKYASGVYFVSYIGSNNIKRTEKLVIK